MISCPGNGRSWRGKLPLVRVSVFPQVSRFASIKIYDQNLEGYTVHGDGFNLSFGDYEIKAEKKRGL